MFEHILRDSDLYIQDEESNPYHGRRKEYDVMKDPIETVRIDKLHLKYIRKKDGRVYDHDEELNNKVSLYDGDITQLQLDSIVNSGNSCRHFTLHSLYV